MPQGSMLGSYLSEDSGNELRNIQTPVLNSQNLTRNHQYDFGTINIAAKLKMLEPS
jgi:hypothetical protein